MDFHRTSWMVALGAFLSSCLLLYECSKLDGYKFPVWSTKSCPRNETEWDDRSSFFNCNDESSYACLPNENLTELLEFCYPLQIISIEKGLCLFLTIRNSRVDDFNCTGFQQGCPTEHYRGSTIYKYPSCVSLGNGCFLQEPSCKSSLTEIPFQGSSTDDATDSSVWVKMAPLPMIIPISVVAIFLLLYFRKTLKSRSNNDEESPGMSEPQPFLDPNADKTFRETSNRRKTKNKNILEGQKSDLMIVRSEKIVFEGYRKFIHKEENLIIESTSLDLDEESNANKYDETAYEQSIFRQWEHDDELFFSTKACKTVESLVKNNNVVIVTGHSGSGKSAIIQHIALKYRKQGWVVKPINKVDEIHNTFKFRILKPGQSLFVFNDPIGKESFDEVLYNEWAHFRETLGILIKNVKVVLTCRTSIILDQRARGFLEEHFKKFDIDDSQCKITREEKKCIFRKHLPKEQFTDEEEFDRICDTNMYFPLLCKLCGRDSYHTENKLKIFEEPVEVLKKEIETYKTKDKETYCALVCLIFNNNEISLHNLKEKRDLFEMSLQLCELPPYTSPATVINKLEPLVGYFVKKFGEKYTFYHDFVMEVTTFVFGSENPAETIKVADLSFLRRRISVEKSECLTNDSFTIFLNDESIPNLVNRLSEELFGDRFIEVVLNPCLRNKQVISGMETLFKGLGEQNILKLINLRETKIKKNELKKHMNESSYSRFDFVSSPAGLSPLFALIAYCHDELSKVCLKMLEQRNIELKGSHLFSAMLSNGDEELMEMFTKQIQTSTEEEISEYMGEEWNDMYPIHIVSVFHNYNFFDKVFNQPVDVNTFTKDTFPWTPLMLVSRVHMNQQKNELESRKLSRREETVEILIKMGADVNLCNTEGYGPLFIACFNGHEATAQLLLNNGAAVNLCNNDGVSPLSIACQNGHEGTAELLLSNGADVNLCDYDGISPLWKACENDHEATAQLLLNNGADVNVCNNNGISPLWIACYNGHENIAQLLLNKGAEVNLCNKHGTSPLYAACVNGEENTVQLLLNNGAELYLLSNYGTSPFGAAFESEHGSIAKLLSKFDAVKIDKRDECRFLLIACQKGDYNTALDLVKKGVDVNFCLEDQCSPLFYACKYEYDTIAKLLLDNGAEVDSCTKDGYTPLIFASKEGNEKIAKILLENSANVNLTAPNGNGFTPLIYACQNRHNAIVSLLLSKSAFVNISAKNGCHALSIACQNGFDKTVELLLNRGADVNLRENDGITPLINACYNGFTNIAKILLEKKAVVNLRDKNGCSPLFKACQNGFVNTVQLLLKEGADVGLCKNDGTSPLIAACGEGHDEIVELLLNKKTDVNQRAKNGCSPLFISCQKGQHSTVKLLLRYNADIALCMNDGTSPLIIACLQGHIGIVELLCQKGGDVDFFAYNNYSPLVAACLHRFDDIATLLLDKGTNVNMCINDGSTALTIACLHGHGTTAQLLLDHGAKVDLCGAERYSPLAIACLNGYNDIAELLLEKGASVDLSANNGFSPLIFACQNGNERIAQLLLHKGANVNLRAKNGCSPLFKACENGRLSIVHLLLKHEADVTLCDNDKRSPLWAACKNGHRTIAALLLKNGAEINLFHDDEKSPLHEAYQYEDIVELLKNRGAIPNLCKS